MNAKKAKLCRKMAYGDDISPRDVKYKLLLNRQIIADPRRQLLQKLKKRTRGVPR